MKNSLLIIISCLVIFNVQAIASIDSDTIKVELNPLLVVAQKNISVTNPDQTIHWVMRDKIQSTPALSIDGLLEQLAGADIRTRGINGTQADISWRGGTFDQVIVLLNGVNITDPQTGHYNLDIPIDISDIERIEIMQVPQALLYGINPFSGALNIITSKNGNKSLKARLTGGSYGTFSQNISLNTGEGQFSTFLSATNQKSDGYKHNTDYKMLDIFANSTYRTANAGKFDFQLGYQQKNYGANGFYSLTYPDQFDNTRTLFGALNWNYALKTINIQSQAYFRGHTDKFELFRYPEKALPWYTGHNYHFNNTEGFKLNFNMLTQYGKFTAGADIRNEHILSNVLGKNIEKPVKALFEENVFYTKRDSRLSQTAFGGIDTGVDNWQLSAAAAFSHAKTFGLNWSGGANIAYNLSDNLKVYASYSRAFRLPTFTDLYYKSASQRSNPNLMSEYSSTYELGSKYKSGKLTMSVSVFYRAGTNLIDWVKHKDSIVWISSNLSNVNAFGADFNLNYRFDNNFADEITLSYSALKMNKPASDLMSKYVLDYLRNKANISFRHNIYKNFKATWQAGYYDREGEYVLTQGSSPESYKPYFSADLRLQWEMKRIKLFTDFKNISNAQYADFGGLIQPGFHVVAGITVIPF